MTSKSETIKKRMGRFYVSKEMVESRDIFDVLSLMQFVPYRVEMRPYTDTFVYLGTSPLFDEQTERFELTPLYVVNFGVSDNDGFSITVERVERGNSDA